MVEFIVAVVAGLLSGVVSGMGLGGGTILIIYLIFFLKMPQLEAQGINLLFFIPTAALAIITHIRAKRIDLKMSVYLTIFAVLGALGGSLLANVINNFYLRKIFAVALLVLGVYEIFRKPKKKAENC